MYEGLFQPAHLLVVLVISLFSFIVPLIIAVVLVCKVWQIGESTSRLSKSLEELVVAYRAKNPS